MPRHVDLDPLLAARAEAAVEPATFTLGGTVFTCIEPVPVSVALDLGRDAGLNGNIFACDQFFRAILSEDQWPAFYTALSKAGVSLTDDGDTDGTGMTAVTAQVLRSLVQRPTSRPSDSADGSPPTGTTSSTPASGEESTTPSTSDSDAS